MNQFKVCMAAAAGALLLARVPARADTSVNLEKAAALTQGLSAGQGLEGSSQKASEIQQTLEGAAAGAEKPGAEAREGRKEMPSFAASHEMALRGRLAKMVPVPSKACDYEDSWTQKGREIGRFMGMIISGLAGYFLFFMGTGRGLGLLGFFLSWVVWFAFIDAWQHMVGLKGMTIGEKVGSKVFGMMGRGVDTVVRVIGKIFGR